MRVALFVPCYVDQFYPRVAVATLRLLESLGCRMEVPGGQTCCGQPMANSGYAAAARACENRRHRTVPGDWCPRPAQPDAFFTGRVTG